jgi:hypothetical protein
VSLRLLLLVVGICLTTPAFPREFRRFFHSSFPTDSFRSIAKSVSWSNVGGLSLSPSPSARVLSCHACHRRPSTIAKSQSQSIFVQHRRILPLGAEGVLPGRHIVSLLRVFKQFTHPIPSGQMVSSFKMYSPL